METFTKDTWHSLPPVILSSPVFTLAAGQNGIWAGGTGGIAWYPGQPQGNDDPHGNEHSPEATPAWQTRISTLPLSLVTALTYKEGLLLAGGVEGIACSHDEGRYWQPALLEDGIASITAFALSPDFGEDQTAVAATMENGILRTDDGGRTWTNASFGLESFEVTALAWVFGPTLLAATSDGIYRSSNAGRAWRRVYAGEELGIDTIAYLSEKVLLATIENGSLLRSLDGGTHWFIDDSTLKNANIISLFVEPMKDGGEMLFVGTFEQGLLRSNDGGKSWEMVYDEVVLSLMSRDTILYAGTDSGVSMSDDDGQTWHDLPCPPVHDLRHLFAYEGQAMLSGAYAGIMQYTGSAWEALPDLPQALMVTAIAPDGSLLLSSLDGLMRLEFEEMNGRAKSSVDGGHRQRSPYKRQILVEGQAGKVNFITFRPHGSSWQAWAASEDGTRLLRSDDEGTTWQSLHPPFGILPLVALQAIPQRLIAATYDPRQYRICIWSSLDDGETWERGLEAETQWPLVATCADPPLMTISTIILLQDATGQWNKVSIGNDGGMIRRVVSMQRNGNRRDDADRDEPHGRETDDGQGGRDTSGLYNTILMALTTTGLQRSDDWGASWQQYNEDLPVEQIIDIAANATDLYVLLTGGQVWKQTV